MYGECCVVCIVAIKICLDKEEKNYQSETCQVLESKAVCLLVLIREDDMLFCKITLLLGTMELSICSLSLEREIERRGIRL